MHLGGRRCALPNPPPAVFFLGLPPLQGQPTPTWNVSTSNWNHRKKNNSQNISAPIQIRVSAQVILNLKNKKLFGGASCTGEFVRPSFSNCFFASGLGCTQCGKNTEWLCNRPSLVEQCWVKYPILVQIGRREQNGYGPSLKIWIPQGHEPSVHWFWNPWCCSKFKAQIGTGRGVASIRSAGFCNGKRAWDSNSYSTASTMSVAQLKMEQRRWSSAPFLAYLPDIPCSQVQVLFRYLQVTYKSPLISTQVSLWLMNSIWAAGTKANPHGLLRVSCPQQP